MTDFTRNQISSLKLKERQVDRWVIPNDRQLLLRSKLGTGWCVRTNRSNSYTYHDQHAYTLTDDELYHISCVVNKAASLENAERQRIGTLVNNYQQFKARCHGDGSTSCFLCGMVFSKFRSQSKICDDCQNAVCNECYIDTLNSVKERLTLCKICSEKRELWKKSGAWFIGTIPPHTVVADSQSGVYSQSATSRSTPIPHRQPLSELNSGRGSYIEEAGSSMGSEVQIRIQKCRYGLDDSDDSDEDDVSNDSGASYSGSLLRFSRDRDPDTFSLNSTHLKNNPLLNLARSNESLNTLTNDEFSATESTQDLRLLSLQPINETEEPNFTKKSRTEVSFHPDTISQKSDRSTALSAVVGFDGVLPRCISIPNADLKDVDYKEEKETESPLGSLVFSLFYKELEETLDVEMIEAQNLPDIGVLYNAYVSINLVPSLGNSRRLRTGTQNNTMNPNWRQKITFFGVSMDELLDKSLVFSVFNEKYVLDTLLGEYRLALRELDAYSLTHYHVYMEKKAALESDEAVVGGEKGKIQLSTRYDTKLSQLFVGIVRCAALHIPHHDKYADPYVKLYLKPDHSKSTKQKTGVKKQTLNPEFHEEFVYKVPLDTLSSRSLEISVWDSNKAFNTFLGGVYLSMSSGLLSEKEQWALTVNEPDRRHDCWVMLRDIVTR